MTAVPDFEAAGDTLVGIVTESFTEGAGVLVGVVPAPELGRVGTEAETVVETLTGEGVPPVDVVLPTPVDTVSDVLGATAGGVVVEGSTKGGETVGVETTPAGVVLVGSAAVTLVDTPTGKSVPPVDGTLPTPVDTVTDALGATVVGVVVEGSIGGTDSTVGTVVAVGTVVTVGRVGSGLDGAVAVVAAGVTPADPPVPATGAALVGATVVGTARTTGARRRKARWLE